MSRMFEADPKHSDKAWAKRHNLALRNTKGVTGFGSVWLKLARNWVCMANVHGLAYDMPIGQDSFVGPEWATIGRSLRAMLNCDLGAALDCGTLDAHLLRIAKMHGIDLD